MQKPESFFVMRGFASALLRFFVTGVATLLPFVVTVFIAGWTVKLADAYVGPSSTFGRFLLTIVGDKYKYPGYLVAYLVVVILIIFLGFLVNRATISRFQEAVDNLFARIPGFGKVYKAVGQVVELFGSKGQNGTDRFGGVGEVRIGNVKVLCLLTSGEPYVLADGKEYLLVFVPNSPIPATGFNLLVPVEDCRRLDLSTEELVKLLMSLGLLGPQVLSKTPATLEAEKPPNERRTA